MTAASPTVADPSAAATPAVPAATPPPNPDRRRRRILVAAFATSPYRGSEPGGGWHVVRHLADHHDVTVLCFPGFDHDARRNYERYLTEHGPLPGLTMAWVEQPPLSRLLQREGVWQRAFYYHGYRSWEKAAYRHAVALHRREPFDLAYRLNMTGFREPGYLWRLDLPYAWGPIAGAVMMPRTFFPLLSRRDRLFYGIRNRLNARQMRSVTRCRIAARKASQLWAVDELNRTMIRRHFGADADLLLDSGCDPDPAATTRDYDGSRPLRIIWSGVHEGRKCLPILLHAMKRLVDAGRRLQLEVLSQGPETTNWQRLARELGLAETVHWTGQLPHARAVAALRDADLFVLTSLQEAATHVVMEALASGLPVVCHDACGMGLAIDDRCGLKVPLQDPATSIAGFAAALEQLLDHPQQIRTLSVGALQRAEELSWSRKGWEIAATFDQILAEPSRPGGV